MAAASSAVESAVDAPERLGEAFRDNSWLSLFQLTADTVLDYFTLSPFFSTEGLRIAGQDVPAQASSVIEYRLRSGWESTPGLFVIERVLRKRIGTAAHNQLTSAVLSVYYCLGGVIYQCPDLALLLSARVEKAAFHLSAAMEAFEAARAETSARLADSSDDGSRTAALPSSALVRLTHDTRVEEMLRYAPL